MKMLRGTFGIVIYFRNFGISNEFKEILGNSNFIFNGSFMFVNQQIC